MKRYPAALALTLALAPLASAQEFAGFGDFKAQIDSVKALSQRQKLITQKEVPHRVMGAGRFETEPTFTTESIPKPGVGQAAIPDVTPYLVRGVDISHYQGDVDWGQVKNDGLSFVYIKATEGADGVDDKFAANWEGARTAGLARGAYHFYNFCKGGTEQAANFLKAVPVDPDALPATIDLEESSDCKKMPAKAAFRKNLAAFVAKVKAAYGRPPVLYINYAIYDKYFSGENDSYRLWIADINHAAPALPDNASWTMWQYGWHGAVAGIPGEVDMDVFNGTPEMLASLEGEGSVMVASAR